MTHISTSLPSIEQPRRPKLSNIQQSTSCPATFTRSTPVSYHYRPLPLASASPLASSSSSSSSSSPSIPSRPSGPKRSHSFCGDLSASTYALASVSGNHLCPEKKTLVAPPLERTLSSIGSRGNHSPPHQQMLRPFSRDHPLPPLYKSPSMSKRHLPRIAITPPGILHKPVRPAVAPIQRPPNLSRLSSSASSRSSSYTLITPAPSVLPGYGLPYGHEVKDCELVDEDAEMVDVVDMPLDIAST